MKWTACGPNALLLQFADVVDEAAFTRSLAIQAELERLPPEGLVEFVPAFTTVLLEFDPAKVASPATLAADIVARLEAVATTGLPPSTLHEIPVNYDGPDLERVAKLHNLTIAEVVTEHVAPIYHVHMLGFAPGFPYLGGLSPRLHTPRLATPRARVPAGSVAIGGEHTGIYSVDSPGGWNIVGHTALKMFDPAKGASGDGPQMFLLKPGDRVKFVPAGT
jgi:inhibitor of KinA